MKSAYTTTAPGRGGSARQTPIGSAKIPPVPDVDAAPWRHPYRFSGRLPFGALALMVGIGIPTASIAGVVGYLGGPIARSIGIGAGELIPQLGAVALAGILGILGWVWGYRQQDVVIGLLWIVAIVVIAVVGFATLTAFVVLLGGMILVAVGYPVVIGAFAGVGVAIGARLGKCRKPGVASLLGVLAGGLAYTAFVGTALQTNGSLHESSRMLDMASPPMSYALMVVDGLIVLGGAGSAARLVYKTPYCEACRAWFVKATTTRIPIQGAKPLVDALATGSARPLQVVPIGTTANDRVDLELWRCRCEASNYNLVATAHWGVLTDVRKGGTTTVWKTAPWFSTTLPASLGAEIERWSTPAPKAAA